MSNLWKVTYTHVDGYESQHTQLIQTAEEPTADYVLQWWTTKVHPGSTPTIQDFTCALVARSKPTPLGTRYTLEEHING